MCAHFIMAEFVVYKYGTVAVFLRRAVIRASDTHAVGSTFPTGRPTLLQPFDPIQCKRDGVVSKGIVRVRFYHTGLAATVTVASTHLPFQRAGNALSTVFWGGVDRVGWPHYVVAGDFDMNAITGNGRAQLADLLGTSYPCPPSSMFTSRDAHDGSKGVLDHVVGSGRVEVVDIIPRAVEDLMPHSARDTVGYNAVGAWPSNHAMVVAKVFF